jgi:hypothetical protein
VNHAPRFVAIVCLTAAYAIALTGCDRPPAPAPAPPLVAPAVVVAPGYTFDPTIASAATSGFTSLEFGARLRVYVKTDRWIPATLTVTRAEGSGTLSRTIRIDVPPSGRVTGPLLDDAGSDDTVRITLAREGVDADCFERRIGVSEPELTADRLREINAASSTQVRSGGLAISAFGVAISSTETSLDPNFGRVVVIDGESSAVGVADAADPEHPGSDAHWLAGFNRLHASRERSR